MIRLSKLTDYAIVLMMHMAAEPTGKSFAARELSLLSGLPLPTVGKVLKKLAKTGFVASKQGARGGYALAHPSDKISVLDMMSALEGPVSLTACSHQHRLEAACEFESRCPTKNPWNQITRTVQQALSGLTLADMRGRLS